MPEGVVPGAPLVALVGRANVGKSRLFNRLLHASRALVEGRPGVTRDRVAALARIEGRAVLLVDTGGLDPEAEAGIPAAVLGQVERLLDRAAVVLFVVDARAGRLPLDAEIAGQLRRAARQVVVVANKADGPRQEAAAAEFHALGFPEVIPTSAEHDRGIADLEMAIAQRLPGEAPAGSAGGEEAALPRLAIIGRPNAGKSSLLNRLLGEEQAIVSEVPGTTRDATDSRVRVGTREVLLIDTAGLRRPGRRSDHLERGSALMALRAIERADLVLLVLDAAAGISDQDARIARLTLDCGRALALVLNKWDLVEGERRRREVERQLERKLGFVRDPLILRVSALTGQGVGRVLPGALDLLAEQEVATSTSTINRVLREAVERNPPPPRGRRRARFYYATRTSSRPFTVLLFLNDPGLVSRGYRRYLESSFRRAFGLRSAPVRLRLRARSRREGREASLAGSPDAPETRSGDARLGAGPGGEEGGGDR